MGKLRPGLYVNTIAACESQGFMKKEFKEKSEIL